MLIRRFWAVLAPLALCGLLAVGCGPSEGGGGGGEEGGGGLSMDGGGTTGGGTTGGGTSTGGTSVTPTIEWGSLRGRFLYDGTAPEPMPVNITKDQEFCGKHNLVDESLVVNKANKGIKNVFVYLYLLRGEKEPKVAPSYEETATGEVALNNINCRFEPHACLLRTTQTLVVGNKDPIGHNTKIDPQDNNGINQLIPAGLKETAKFPNEESVPARVSCSIHPWMNAWLLIRSNPYIAVTDEDGNFEIKDLPAGEWTMQVWHEKAGYLADVEIAGKNWSKGRVKVPILTGDVDWGDIKVKPDVFTTGAE